MRERMSGKMKERLGKRERDEDGEREKGRAATILVRKRAMGKRFR